MRPCGQPKPLAIIREDWASGSSPSVRSLGRRAFAPWVRAARLVAALKALAFSVPNWPPGSSTDAAVPACLCPIGPRPLSAPRVGRELG